MSNFKVGDKVIALTNPSSEGSQPRIKGEIYCVNAVSYCGGCGKQRINIGYYISHNNTGYIDCSSCNYSQPNNGLCFTDIKHFSKVDNKALENAVEEENYELASVLRDLLCHI